MVSYSNSFLYSLFPLNHSVSCLTMLWRLYFLILCTLATPSSLFGHCFLFLLTFTTSGNWYCLFFSSHFPYLVVAFCAYNSQITHTGFHQFPVLSLTRINPLCFRTTSSGWCSAEYIVSVHLFKNNQQDSRHSYLYISFRRGTSSFSSAC